MNTDLEPLGSAPVGSLLAKFAIPAIISMLVNALYNIVDQIFIGQGVGMLGNAATNIAFPVTTISTAAALLLGIGGASNYNLEMGAACVSNRLPRRFLYLITTLKETNHGKNFTGK